MADTPFGTLWADAKAAFTKASNRKKPSEKFLGFFRRQSGLEKATADLDKALDKASLDNLKALSVALDKFTAAKDNYMKTLTAAQNREEEPDNYKTACTQLRKKLEAMEPDFIERRREKLKESLNERLTKLHKTIEFDVVGTQTSVMNQGATIGDAKGEIKAGKLLKPGALKSIQNRQEVLSNTFVQCEAKILPEIKEYCKYFGVKNLRELDTPRKQAMQLDGMGFILQNHNQNATALESLIKDSDKATKEYNAKALVPLRAAVAAFDELRRSAARIADPWMYIRGKDLITTETAREINNHLATTFQALDRATKMLVEQIENADKVLNKNGAQLGEMAKVVKSVHKYDGAIGRLQAKVTAALKIKLTKKSTKDDVCKLGSPLVSVLRGIVGLEA